MRLRLVERVLHLILGLLAITLVTIIFAAPDSLAIFFTGIGQVNFIIRLVGVLVIDIAILALLYIRLRPRRVPGDGLVVKASGAVADVSVDSARTLILNTIRQVPEVTSAAATLKAVNGKADIEMDVSVKGRDINVPRKQQEINRALKQVVYKQLGLQLANQPRVHIHLGDEQVLMKEPDAEVVVTPEISKQALEPTTALPDLNKTGNAEKAESLNKAGGAFSSRLAEKQEDIPASAESLPAEKSTETVVNADDWSKSYESGTDNSQSTNQNS